MKNRHLIHYGSRQSRLTASRAYEEYIRAAKPKVGHRIVRIIYIGTKNEFF